jgi:hypothetical protein
MINNRLSWKNHIDVMIPKPNTATYVIRSLKQLLNVDTLKKAYFSFAHSILSYGIIFWGILNYSENIFKIQKRIIRIIMNVDSRTSCRSLFKQLGILPLQSQYTGCNRRNRPDFGRVFLMLKYTDITQNTYVQS